MPRTTDKPKRWRTTAFLAAVCLCLWGCERMDKPTAADAPPPLDGRSALRRVADLIALGPRTAGTPGAATAAEWLAARCRETGCEVRIDGWTEETVDGTKTFRNVVAVVPGARGQRVILGSHYDTKALPGIEGFIGANDSGSSTGLLLEILHTLAAAKARPPWTLECVFFDGEECLRRYGPRDGLHGSRYHAGQIHDAKRTRQYRAMLLLDMVGDRDLAVRLPTDTDPELARLTFAAAEDLGVRQAFGYLPAGGILDDHVPFAEIGLPAIDLIDFEYGPANAWWHTAEDTLDKLSADSLATVGNVTLRLLWRLPAR